MLLIQSWPSKRNSIKFSISSSSGKRRRKNCSTNGLKMVWILPPFICFTYHPDFLVESADSFLPPVADPAEWWAFCDSRHGLVKTRQFRDEWKAYQYRGDKLAAFAFTRVTNKYSLPVGWVTTLGEIFTSNQYWAKFERVFELNVYCDGVYNRTPNQSYLDGNVLEVSILFLL